jgi:hypothetical protein
MGYWIGILRQNWYIVLALGVFIIGSVVYSIARLQMIRRSNKKFLLDHPDAVKVFLAARAFMTSETVTVSAVDGAVPQQFMEKGKIGFYAIPGKRVVEMQYTHSRPGILHRTVTQVYGPVTRELETLPGRNYLLGFDRKAQSFTFGEA